MTSPKMSDVFELPLLVGTDNHGRAELGDANYHLADFDDTLTYDDGKGELRAELCAIAVNAYDANQAKIAELEEQLFNLRQESESELNRAAGIIEELSEADSMGDLCKIVRCHGLDFGDNNGN